MKDSKGQQVATRSDKGKAMSIDPSRGRGTKPQATPGEQGTAQGSDRARDGANGKGKGQHGADARGSRKGGAQGNDERAQQIYEKAQQRERQKEQRAGKKRAGGKEGKGAVAFVKGTIKELKLTTWPKPAELVRWCLIVIATVGLLAAGAMVVDNFVATPVMMWISSLNIDTDGTFGIVDIILLVLMFISGIGSIAGIYMHSGGDTEGLSDTMATRLTGGSGQAQKNLDRITIVCIIVFVLCLVVALVVYPQGAIVSQ